MSRTRAVIAALLVLPALLLAGCSDDEPEPRLAAPSPSAASPSESGATEPALGPEETVRAWVAARNAALQTGDTTDVEALSVARCTSCENSVAPIREVHANGGHFDTDGWAVVSTRVKSQSSGRARVSAAIEYAAGETVPKIGAAPVKYGVERHIVLVDLVKAGDRWQVGLLGYIS